MTGFYFAFLAVLLAGIGARDQVAVAGLVLRQGARPGVLVVAVAVSLATAALAGWAATAVAPLLAPPARLFFAALALALAGGESLLIRPRRGPQEPTASLGALAVVLLAHQATDAARFLIFAVAVASGAPLPAAIGGAAGGAAMVAAGWLAPELATHPRTRTLRLGLGVVLLLAGLFVGLRALGRI
jgi:hypothetical protein